jgi:hypothetical protein
LEPSRKLAKQVLSQLSYTATRSTNTHSKALSDFAQLLFFLAIRLAASLRLALLFKRT